MAHILKSKNTIFTNFTSIFILLFIAGMIFWCAIDAIHPFPKNASLRSSSLCRSLPLSFIGHKDPSDSYAHFVIYFTRISSEKLEQNTNKIIEENWIIEKTFLKCDIENWNNLHCRLTTNAHRNNIHTKKKETKQWKASWLLNVAQKCVCGHREFTQFQNATHTQT